MRWLHAKGLQPTNVIDRRQDIDDAVGRRRGHASSATCSARPSATGIEILDDVDVVNVVDAHLAYFDAIGAVGPPAAGDDVTEL